MKRQFRRLWLATVICLLPIVFDNSSASAADGLPLPNVSELYASNPQHGARYGWSVDIDGDYAIVGAYMEDHDHNVGCQSGAAYVYRRTGEVWHEDARLLDEQPTCGDMFGWDVAIDGPTVAVGAIGKHDGTGSVAVFERADDGIWRHLRDLTADDISLSSHSRLGYSVDIDGDYVVAGAPKDDPVATQAGSALVFIRDGSDWSQQKLVADDAAENDRFGTDVAVAGQRVLVGTPFKAGAGPQSGAVYVFDEVGTDNAPSWVQKVKLVSNARQAGEHFGISVDLSGDAAIIGANFHVNGGAAYIFQRLGDSWRQKARLRPEGLIEGDDFGVSVAIDGDVAVVGAQGRGQQIDGARYPDAGAGYVFTVPTDGWHAASEPDLVIRASNVISDLYFASAVAVTADATDGFSILAGALNGTTLPHGQGGVAYLFDYLKEDLSVVGMEVTQGIQHYRPRGDLVPHNLVPLVAGKTTWVRLYAQSKLEIVCGVGSTLEVLDASDAVLAEISPANGPICAKPTGSDRGESNDTLNFRLPDHVTSGAIKLRARIWPEESLDEVTTANNLYQVDRAFHERDQLDIVLIRIEYKDYRNGRIHVPSVDAYQTSFDYARKVYPAPDVVPHTPTATPIYRFSGYLTRDPDETDPIEIKVQEDLAKEEWTRLVTLIGKLDFFDGTYDVPGHTEDFQTYGLLSDSVVFTPYDGLMLGTAAAGREYGHESIPKQERGTVMAHEVGHLLGRWHVDSDRNANSEVINIDCGDPAGIDWQYPTYLKPDGTPYKAASIGEFGFDPVTQAVYHPDKTYDFMSYCHPGWISPHQFNALYLALGAPDAVASSAPHPSGGSVLVVAKVDFDSGEGTLNEIYVNPDRTTQIVGGPAGPYRLVLLDRDFQVLHTHDFDFNVGYAGHGDGPASTVQVLPFVEGTERIAFYHGTTLLDQRAASNRAPVVSVLQPSDGQALSGIIDVRWTADDADGDSLLFVVQYSTDGGKTWSAADADLTENQYALDTSLLAGTSQGKIRIVASDGFHTSSSDSDGLFSVGKKAPIATIQTPGLGKTIVAGQPVTFAGSAIDVEDGILMTDEQLSWRSNRDGDLGDGSQVEADGLSVGEHQVTLTAVDSDGQTGEASVTVLVLSSPSVDEPVNALAVAVGGATLAGEMVSFEATVAGGTNVHFYWDFGDGTARQGARMVAHQYERAGIYTVTTIASNREGMEGVETLIDIAKRYNVYQYLPIVLNQ